MPLKTPYAPALAAAVLALTGCSKPVALWGDLVVGPDLAAAGPFTAPHIRLAGDTADKDATPMRIDIRHDATDSATLTGVLEGTKPYQAAVTWHAFTPVIADTRAASMDYWLFGLNLTRTPDRSIYGLMRLPHGAGSAANGRLDGVEYVLLSCSDLDFAREATFETETHAKIKLDAAPPPQAGSCEFNTLDEAYAVTQHLLKNYDRVRHVKDAPALDWQPVTTLVN